MYPAEIGFNSITEVLGLQNVKFANPAPCKPTIFDALLNKFTCSLKLKSLSLIIENPFFNRLVLTSSSFMICLK